MLEFVLMSALIFCLLPSGGKSISDPQNFHSQPHSERSCHDSSSVNSTISDFTNCLIDIGRGSILEPGNCQIGKCPLLGLSSGAEDSTVLEGVTKLPFDVLSAPDCFFLFQGVTIAGTSTFQEALSSSVFTIYHIEVIGKAVTVVSLFGANSLLLLFV